MIGQEIGFKQKGEDTVLAFYVFYSLLYTGLWVLIVKLIRLSPDPAAFEIISFLFGLAHREGLAGEDAVEPDSGEEVVLVHNRQIKAHTAGL